MGDGARAGGVPACLSPVCSAQQGERAAGPWAAERDQGRKSGEGRFSVPPAGAWSFHGGLSPGDYRLTFSGNGKRVPQKGTNEG